MEKNMSLGRIELPPSRPQREVLPLYYSDKRLSLKERKKKPTYLVVALRVADTPFDDGVTPCCIPFERGASVS